MHVTCKYINDNTIIYIFLMTITNSNFIFFIMHHRGAVILLKMLAGLERACLPAVVQVQ